MTNRADARDRPLPAAGRSALQLSTTSGGAAHDNNNAPDPLIGLIVAERYRILDLLGRGGMGVVYRVEHVRIGKLLAMKLLAGELSRNPEAVRRFKHEAQTASKLSSPNTVQVFDFGAADGLTYLVMELVGGEDLGTVLRAELAIDPRRLCKIVLQIGNSLAEAHNHGIVHRDVKPENVMLVRGKEGQEVVKVFDFGLAKLRAAAEAPAMTTPGLIMGTPYFMAPEQIRGESVDARTDIYALGAVMYRALAGVYPFDGPSPIAVCAKHLTEEPPPLSRAAPQIAFPKGLADVVMKALEKDPEKRFQVVDDLQAAVAEVLAADGTPVTPFDSTAIRAMTADGPGIVHSGADPHAVATRNEVETYERSLRRKKWGLYAALAVVPVAAAAGGAFWFTRPPTPFDGFEREPNEETSSANTLPIGTPIRGFIGKRLTQDKGDVDFFAFQIQGDAPVARVELRALPNIATCLHLFRRGQPTAFAQYCTGAPGVDLVFPQLAIGEGSYLAAVKQDLDPRGAPRVFTHENVSDTYELGISIAMPSVDRETEPNDAVAFASPIAVGHTLRGAIGFAGDDDFVCADVPDDVAVTFRVSDVPRAAGIVIEATPVRAGSAEAARRVYGHDHAQTATDVKSPWTYQAPPGAKRCISVRLGFDPAVPAAAGPSKLGAREEWSIEVMTP